MVYKQLKPSIMPLFVTYKLENFTDNNVRQIRCDMVRFESNWSVSMQRDEMQAVIQYTDLKKEIVEQTLCTVEEIISIVSIN